MKKRKTSVKREKGEEKGEENERKIQQDLIGTHTSIKRCKVVRSAVFMGPRLWDVNLNVFESNTRRYDE